MASTDASQNSSAVTPTAAAAAAPPAVAKHERGRNSASTTAGIIIADVVGAGILGMPVAVSHFGWALGLVVLSALLAANVHISILLWRACMMCPGSRNYGDLAANAFKHAPAWQRRMASWGTEVPQLVSIFAFLGLYLLCSARGLGMLFYDLEVCLPEWAAFAGMIILPFAGTIRQMGSMRWLIWLNIFTLSLTVVIPLVHMAVFSSSENLRPQDSPSEPIAPLSTAGVLSGLSSFTFGLSSQIVLVEIIDEMEDPQELPKAYASLSAPFQWIAFAIAGVGGYLLIGNKATGMISENLPFGVVFRIAAACLATHMLISYFIKSVVFCKVAHARVDPEFVDGQSPRTWGVWNAISLSLLIGGYLVANIVPFFTDAVDLFGASLAPLLCWVLPIVFFIRVRMDSSEKVAPVSRLEWCIIASELTLAAVLMVFGTATAVQNIISSWHTYGYPFDCHCEGVWDTCACSGDHVGMAATCAESAVAVSGFAPAGP